MQESSDVTTVPRDIWFQVCLHLSVKSLYMLRATSRELRETVDSRTVWLSVLTDLIRIKPSAYSKQDVEDMSAADLRKASLRIVLVDRAYSSPTLPHREVALFSREDVVGCTQTLLFPGGKRLLILRASGSFTIYDISARKTVVDVPPTNTRASSQRSTSTAQLFPTSLYTGHIVIHLSPPFEFRPGPAVAEQLRVVLHFGHAFYHQDGVLSIAQLHLPHANDMSSLELHLRTFVAGGRDERVLKRFRIDELRPEVSLVDHRCTRS
ncbi:hypothetical protein BC629DRAFT_313552 [Irpex lacteus]|nr:hypothetical protein BC629DRAFT_313552 [Irpex lacteus]